MRGRTISMAVMLFVLAMLVGLWPAGQAEAQGSRCFPETGQCIAGSIRTYWERNGGLPIFGFPITEQRQETVEGRSLQVQWFERDRIEIQADGSVTTGRLGVDRLAQMGTPWTPGNKLTPDAGCVAFRETGHQVCGTFARYWQQNGGLNRLGLPITGEFQTTIEGQNLTVQYFERRRFELHGGQVLLGLLGREVLGGGTPAPAPDSCADVPEPVNARIRPGKCFTAGTQAVVDVFGFRANEEVGLWINAPDGSIVGTRRTLNIGPTGVANDIPLNTNGLTPGIWSLVVEGTSSGNKAIAYFKITGGAPPPPPPSGACADVPEPVNARIRPGKCFAAGTQAAVDVFGFRPNEEVGLWINAPDGSVVGTRRTLNIGPTGAINDIPLDTTGLPAGIWSLVVEGTRSGHKAIAYFRIQ